MNKFVYRWPFFFWLSILLGLAAFFAVKSTTVSVSGSEELRNLVDSSPRKLRKERNKETRELTQQTRLGVTKQVYVVDGPLRRLIDLTAVSSKVRVIAKRPHMRVVETFYDVTGYVQHELFYVTQDGKEVIYSENGTLAYRSNKPLEPELSALMLFPKQRFRYFKAKEAIYDFHTSQLLAYEVKFWTFTVDGHEKVADPFAFKPEAVGEAKSMTFYVSGPENKNQFSAEFLKVQFTPEGGI